MPSPYDSSSSGTGSPTGYTFDSQGNPYVASSIAAGSSVRVAGSARQPATHGSRTMILDPTETNEEPTNPVVGVLELMGEPSTGRRVQWDEEVVDNENMGKKKSKSKRFLVSFWLCSSLGFWERRRKGVDRETNAHFFLLRL